MPSLSASDHTLPAALVHLGPAARLVALTGTHTLRLDEIASEAILTNLGPDGVAGVRAVHSIGGKTLGIAGCVSGAIRSRQTSGSDAPGSR